MTPCQTPHPWHLKTADFLPGFVVMVWQCKACETRKTQHRPMPSIEANRNRLSAGYAASWQQRYIDWR